MASQTDASGAEGRLDDPQALLASLAVVLDEMPMAVAVFDADLRLRHCNRTWRRWAEQRTSGAVAAEPGMHLTECVPGIEPKLEVFGQALQEGRAATYEAFPLETDHGTVYGDVTVAPLVKDGVTTGFVQIAVDATDRVAALRTLERRVDERTRELERRREVADGLHEILTILNSCCPTDEVLDYIVRQARRLLGSDAVSVYRLERTGQAIVTIGSHGLDEDLLRNLAFPTHEGFVAGTVMKRIPLVMPDSSVVWGPITDRMLPDHRDRVYEVFTRFRSLLAVPILIGDRVWGALAMFFPDPRLFPAEDVALASDLADHLALALENAELREQAEESATMAERGRLARDLHDAVTQTLFSASLVAEVLPRLWERDRAEGERRLEQLRHLTRGALAEMRTLLLELRPAALVEADLADVLRQLAESTATAGVDVRVGVEGMPRPLTADVQVALYRTAQEALNNVAKHASAARADVVLRYLPGAVDLTVEDDGAGFDPSGVGGDHMGLRIMRERAEAVGGALTVASRPGGGTRISVTVDDAGREECGCQTPSVS